MNFCQTFAPMQKFANNKHWSVKKYYLLASYKSHMLCPKTMKFERIKVSICVFIVLGVAVTFVEYALTSTYRQKVISQVGNVNVLTPRVSRAESYQSTEKQLSQLHNASRGDCMDLFPVSKGIPLLDKNSVLKYKAYHLALQRIIYPDIRFVEGNSGDFPEQSRIYFEIGRQEFVKTVCEVGLNAGHGTLIWLLSNPEILMYSFEIGIYYYSRPMANVLQRLFPDRLWMVYGNSSATIPEFLARYPSVKCDVIIIDGDHEVVYKNDFDNMRSLASRDGHLLIVDDTPASWSDHSLGRLWQDHVHNGTVHHIFSCGLSDGTRGFTIGHYTDLK